MTTGPFDRFGKPGRQTPRSCDVQASGAIELFFYGELDAAEQARVDAHLSGCRQCREALDDLRLIRDALATRVDVAAPPAGDWSGFMTRLGSAIERDAGTPRVVEFPVARAARRTWMPAIAAAALFAIVTASVMATWHARNSRRAAPVGTTAVRTAEPQPAAVAPPDDEAKAALASLSGQHLERSKLVVLGMANKDAGHASARDWHFERQLASDLLTDTRLYRLAAEDRGLDDVARVMRDLELVLLQTSMSADSEPATLAQIQRLIQKRDLVGRMSVVNAAGL